LPPNFDITYDSGTKKMSVTAATTAATAASTFSATSASDSDTFPSRTAAAKLQSSVESGLQKSNIELSWSQNFAPTGATGGKLLVGMDPVYGLTVPSVYALDNSGAAIPVNIGNSMTIKGSDTTTLKLSSESRSLVLTNPSVGGGNMSSSLFLGHYTSYGSNTPYIYGASDLGADLPVGIGNSLEIKSLTTTIPGVTGGFTGGSLQLGFKTSYGESTPALCAKNYLGVEMPVTFGQVNFGSAATIQDSVSIRGLDTSKIKLTSTSANLNISSSDNLSSAGSSIQLGLNTYVGTNKPTLYATDTDGNKLTVNIGDSLAIRGSDSTFVKLYAKETNLVVANNGATGSTVQIGLNPLTGNQDLNTPILFARDQFGDSIPMTIGNSFDIKGVDTTRVNLKSTASNLVVTSSGGNTGSINMGLNTYVGTNKATIYALDGLGAKQTVHIGDSLALVGGDTTSVQMYAAGKNLVVTGNTGGTGSTLRIGTNSVYGGEKPALFALDYTGAALPVNIGDSIALRGSDSTDVKLSVANKNLVVTGNTGVAVSTLQLGTNTIYGADTPTLFARSAGDVALPVTVGDSLDIRRTNGSLVKLKTDDDGSLIVTNEFSGVGSTGSTTIGRRDYLQRPNTPYIEAVGRDGFTKDTINFEDSIAINGPDGTNVKLYASKNNLTISGNTGFLNGDFSYGSTGATLQLGTMSEYGFGLPIIQARDLADVPIPVIINNSLAIKGPDSSDVKLYSLATNLVITGNTGGTGGGTGSTLRAGTNTPYGGEVPAIFARAMNNSVLPVTIGDSLKIYGQDNSTVTLTSKSSGLVVSGNTGAGTMRLGMNSLYGLNVPTVYAVDDSNAPLPVTVGNSLVLQGSDTTSMKLTSDTTTLMVSGNTGTATSLRVGMNTAYGSNTPALYATDESGGVRPLVVGYGFTVKNLDSTEGTFNTANGNLVLSGTGMTGVKSDVFFSGNSTAFSRLSTSAVRVDDGTLKTEIAPQSVTVSNTGMTQQTTILKNEISISNTTSNVVQYSNSVKDYAINLSETLTKKKISFDVSQTPPTFTVSKGNTGPFDYQLSNSNIQPATVEILGLNNDKSECNIYSSTGTGYARYPDNYNKGSYIMMNNFADIGNGASTIVGGTYIDYSDTVGNLTRYFQGYNAPSTGGLPVPTIAAVKYNVVTGGPTAVNIATFSPVTFFGNDMSTCTVTAANSGLSVLGGTSIVSDTAGPTILKYMTVQVDGTDYKIPLYGPNVI
jgi:hypothetical protein